MIWRLMRLSVKLSSSKKGTGNKDDRWIFEGRSNDDVSLAFLLGLGVLACLGMRLSSIFSLWTPSPSSKEDLLMRRSCRACMSMSPNKERNRTSSSSVNFKKGFSINYSEVGFSL